MNTSAPLLEMTRGSVVEAIHRGSIAVVGADGSLIKSYGDPDTVAFLRSSAKPFQVLPPVDPQHLNYLKPRGSTKPTNKRSSNPNERSIHYP